MIQSVTTMRLEMLGTAFTFQHSDCRVLDQLVYKWAHSRACLAKSMATEVLKMVESGASYTRAELRRDIGLLCGGSYEHFCGGGQAANREIDSAVSLAAARPLATVVDVREEGKEKEGGVCEGAIAVPWSTWVETGEGVARTPPTGCGIPEDRESVIITHCMGGGRGGKSKLSLMKLGYKNVLNGAGPQKADVWGSWARK
jgi:rhodanese-related sulfurtransferase